MNERVGEAPADTPSAMACQSVCERSGDTRPKRSTRSGAVSRSSRGWPSLSRSAGTGGSHRLVEELDDVSDLELLVAGRLGGVLEARDLVGAADGEDLGAGLGRLADPPLGQALGRVVRGEAVEPHPAAAAAAAVAVLPAAAHLDEADAWDRLDEGAGLVVLAVVAPEIAGIV